MERIDQYAVYELATAISSLTQLRDDILAHAALWPIMEAREKVYTLLIAPQAPIRLGLARDAAQELLTALDTVHNAYFVSDDGKFKFPEDTAKIPGWRIMPVHTAVQNFQAIMRAEARVSATYAVPKRGIYDVADLVDRAEQCIPTDLAREMGDKAIPEIQQAGRCLAFGLSSAVGFHICRAVEAVMEEYYKFFTGKTKELYGWQAYISALEKVASDPSAVLKPEERTMRHLSLLKDSSRNPIMHPRIVLNEVDADALFSEGKALMVLMAQELKHARSNPPPVSSALGSTLRSG